MTLRSALAALSLFGAGLAASPALAQSIDPGLVLAADGHAKSGHVRPGRGFAGRTARLTSIMGPETSAVAPLHVPTKPVWTRPARREADASAGLR